MAAYAAYFYNTDEKPRLRELKRRKQRGMHRRRFEAHCELISYLKAKNDAKGVALFRTILAHDEGVKDHGPSLEPDLDANEMLIMDSFVCETTLKLCELRPREHAATAVEIFRLRKSLPGRRLPESTYTLLICILAKAGNIAKALLYLTEMKDVGLLPRHRTFTTLLKEFCLVADPLVHIDSIKSLYKDMRKTLMGKDPAPIYLSECEFTAILSMCARYANSFDKSSDEAPFPESILSFFYAVLKDSLDDVFIPGKEFQNAIKSWFSTAAVASSGLFNCTLGVQRIPNMLVKRWTLSENCIVDSNTSVCGNCGTQMRSIELAPADATQLKVSAKALFRSTKRGRDGKTNFSRFVEWLDQKASSHGAYDYVIDGANVGHYAVLNRSRGMNYEGIECMMNHLENNGKRALLILHRGRIKNAPSDTARKLVAKWAQEGNMYVVPFGDNDDWYWLYAAVHVMSCIVVSNDLMRDHVFESLSGRYFKWWRERHVAKFTYRVSEKGSHDVVVRMPTPHSVRVQQSFCGLFWHMPCRRAADGTESEQYGDHVHDGHWTCIRADVRYLLIDGPRKLSGSTAITQGDGIQ